MNNESGETAKTVVNESGSGTDPTGAAPGWVYFYYVRKKSDHSKATADSNHDDWELQVFVEKRKYQGDLAEPEIRELAAAAEAGKLRRKGKAMEDVVLRHKAYMLFVWKEAGRSLKMVHFKLRGEPAPEHPNFDNFDSMTLSHEVSVVTCVNTRKDKHGGPLGNKSETFDVRFETDPELPEMLMRIMIHNENTTNTGP
jgi:hypothetical protein